MAEKVTDTLIPFSSTSGVEIKKFLMRGLTYGSTSSILDKFSI